MEQLPILPQSWFGYLTGAMVAFVLWVVRGYASDLKTVKEKYISREEFEKHLAKLQAEFSAALLTRDTAAGARMDVMHSDNGRNFDRLAGCLDAVNTKLFDLSGRIPVTTK